MEWLLYPAYPRHSFSLRDLVHICIPHTGTPCGRGLYRQGLTRLSWVLPSASALLPSLCFYYSTLLAICQGVSANFLSILLHFLLATLQTSWGTRLEVCYSPLTPLLYHNLGGLSRVFSSVQAEFSIRNSLLRALLVSVYLVIQGITFPS